MGAKHDQTRTQHGLCAPSIMVYIHVLCTHEYHFASLFSSPTILSSHTLSQGKCRAVWQYIRIDLPTQQRRPHGIRQAAQPQQCVLHHHEFFQLLCASGPPPPQALSFHSADTVDMANVFGSFPLRLIFPLPLL